MAEKLGCDAQSYFSLEIKPVFLQRTKKKFNVIKYDLEIGVLPFPDNTFDVVLLTNILEHLNNHVKISKEAYRVLRVGGKLYASVPSENSHYVWDDFTHRRGYTKRAIAAELKSAGFKNLVISTDYNIILTRGRRFLPSSVISLFLKMLLKKFCDIDRTIDTYVAVGLK